MNIDDPHGFLEQWRQLYNETTHVPDGFGPDMTIWFCSLEEIPQEIMDASIADLDTE